MKCNSRVIRVLFDLPQENKNTLSRVVTDPACGCVCGSVPDPEYRRKLRIDVAIQGITPRDVTELLQDSEEARLCLLAHKGDLCR